MSFSFAIVVHSHVYSRIFLVGEQRLLFVDIWSERVTALRLMPWSIAAESGWDQRKKKSLPCGSLQFVWLHFLVVVVFVMDSVLQWRNDALICIQLILNKEVTAGSRIGTPNSLVPCPCPLIHPTFLPDKEELYVRKTNCLQHFSLCLLVRFALCSDICEVGWLTLHPEQSEIEESSGRSQAL